jgi:uncharacterized flavoprotein (TIGR03862 family)
MNSSNVIAAIVGAGPAGLMAAEVISRSGIAVDVYDAMPSAGRKFLMAGKGGMNITHAEPFERFIARYGERRAELEPMLRGFSPDALRSWMHELGIDTFIGSSGRVFPAGMKAAPLLRAWLHRLRSQGVRFHMRHRWCGWTDKGHLRFLTPNGEAVIASGATVLALGGGSWPQLGSNGAWVSLLSEREIEAEPLKPANCGFTVGWSEQFRNRFAGHPLKTIRVNFRGVDNNEHWQAGELTITGYGMEGGPI